LPYSLGTVPVLKQKLYKICKNDTEHWFFKMSTGI
jgi:hypothetical protein